MWHLSSCVSAYRKSTVHALEIGLGLGNILWIWIISYMEITYFHLLCNYLQKYILIKIPPLHPPTPPKKIPPTHFHSQQCSCLQWLYIWINQTQLAFLDTVEMGLITDMQTYKTLSLLTPNVNYSGRTPPLTSKVAFYIFIQQI